MSKAFIGLIVLVLGGVAGWYYFSRNPNAPSMQIGDNIETPAPASSDNPFVPTTQAPGVGGGDKGGVVSSSVVSYTNSGYLPVTITVKKGTKVSFTNNSDSGMWTASGSHPTHQLLPGFDQLKSVNRGGVYEYTFDKVGTWLYHNHVKASDTGTVIVTE